VEQRSYLDASHGIDDALARTADTFGLGPDPRENSMELVLLLLLALMPVPAPPAEVAGCPHAMEEPLKDGGIRCAPNEGARRVTAATEPTIGFKAAASAQ
jgi:hypothetical protein